MATKIKFTSPFGSALYPHISSPDTVGQYADNKYKTKLVADLSAPGIQEFITKIDEAASAIHGAKGAKLYKPYVIDEDAGEVTFIFKTQYAPAIFDARNNAVKNLKVGSGSILRILGQFVEFEKGISAQFNQVQIRELNSQGSSGFDAVDDGYEFSADDASTFEDTAPSSNDTSNSASDASDNTDALEI